MWRQKLILLAGLCIVIIYTILFFTDSGSFWEGKGSGKGTTSGFIFLIVGLMLVFFSAREIKEEYDSQRQIRNSKKRRERDKLKKGMLK